MLKQHTHLETKPESIVTKPLFKLFLVTGLILFSLLTVAAVIQYGFIGIFSEAFQNFATIQIFVDLLIALIFVLIWMWFDAKKNNRPFWPWALVTLAVGSFGPLFYLLFYKNKSSK